MPIDNNFRRQINRTHDPSQRNFAWIAAMVAYAKQLQKDSKPPHDSKEYTEEMMSLNVDIGTKFQFLSDIYEQLKNKNELIVIAEQFEQLQTLVSTNNLTSINDSILKLQREWTTKFVTSTSSDIILACDKLFQYLVTKGNLLVKTLHQSGHLDGQDISDTQLAQNLIRFPSEKTSAPLKQVYESLGPFLGNESMMNIIYNFNDKLAQNIVRIPNQKLRNEKVDFVTSIIDSLNISIDHKNNIKDQFAKDIVSQERVVLLENKDALKQNNIYRHAVTSNKFNRNHQFEINLNKNSSSAMKARYSSLRGDHLKTEILAQFRKDISECQTESELTEKVDQFKKSDEYKIIQTAQGLVTKGLKSLGLGKTDSEVAVEKLIAERKDNIQQIAYSINK